MATVYLAEDLSAANALVDQGYLFARDVPAVVERATAHRDWATGGKSKR